ncbi:cupin domain-containing protein [Nonomuraea sp. NPDC050556]|uniref:cupin domain-containing protein n=1 Tax=Nonomuraea sp. NPDC050556 TaxID=3364369 RepID=UPI0037AD99EF
MPIVSAADSPVFELDHVTAKGGAAPSRGADETSMWRFALHPGAPATPHQVTREEIFVVVTGRGVAELEGETHELEAGDTLIVPPHTPFSLSNPYDEKLKVVAILPVGAQAIMPGMDPFTPPWAS